MFLKIHSTALIICDCRVLVHLVRRLFTIPLTLAPVMTLRMPNTCLISPFVSGDELNDGFKQWLGLVIGIAGVTVGKCSRCRFFEEGNCLQH